MKAASDFADALGHTGNIEWPALKALEALLKAHAHELAEKIRAEHDTKRPGYHMGLKCREVAECYVRDLADLIDPEVA
ncbi:hypothetical protein [Streptomyces sp. NPDC057747]